MNDTYTYKEYAPNALEIYLTGDFNQWNHKQYPLVNDGNGVWTLVLPEGILDFYWIKPEIIEFC